jgi:hypothetical protein
MVWKLTIDDYKSFLKPRQVPSNYSFETHSNVAFMAEYPFITDLKGKDTTMKLRTTLPTIYSFCENGLRY